MKVLPTPASPIRITKDELEMRTFEREKNIKLTFEKIIMIMSDSIHFF